MDMTDRVLALFQTRFPREFEICYLTAQNEILSAQVAQTQVGDDAEPETETELGDLP